MNYFLLDVETNGLDSKVHEVSEISIIRCADLKQMTRLIKIERPEKTSPRALEATGRTFADLKKGISKEEAVEACHNFILSDDAPSPEHRCIIGHNVFAFDRRFVIELWNKCGKVFPATFWLDTKVMAKEYAKKNGMVKPSLTLKSCLGFCNIKPRGKEHTAVSDTQNNYILYDFLKKNGVDHLPYIKRHDLEENYNSDDEEDT